jgi:conjugal transfer pilus assembly protein TraE
LKSLLQQSRLNHLIKQRNGYLVLAAGLLLICLFLTLLCFSLSHRERIVLVPPNISHSFWVTSSQASPEYLSEMTTFFAYLRLNVTPVSSDSQRELLLRYVDPRHFGALNTALIAERDRMAAEHLSTAFYPVTVRVNAKALSAIIVGDLIATVGKEQLSSKRIAYQLQYRYDQGRLFVSQFQEMKTHD